MNVRTGRILTLTAALLAATATTAFASDDSQSQSNGHALSAQEKAIEAQRLAKQAAALAQQAAALAAESQEDAAPASNEKKQDSKSAERNESSRDSAEVRPSDPNPHSSTNDNKGQPARGRQESNDVQIRFRDEKPAANASDRYFSDSASDRQSLNDANVHLASRMMADGDLRNANEQEPMPTPANGSNSNGSNSNSRQNVYSGDGTGYGGCNGCGACNSCNSCGSGGCDLGCCAPSPCLFWTAGVEATFLSPNLKDTGATFDYQNIGDQRECFSSTHGLDSVYVAPRIWLGVESCCWGVDVKYWQMRASTTGWDPSVGAGGLWNGPDCGVADVGHFSENSMSAYSLDLEVTRRLCVRDCWMQFSGGVRHAEFRHDEFITGNVHDTLVSGQQQTLATDFMGYGRDDSFSQGTGIVLGWYGRRPVFPCSCVNWFYNLRYSVLWGPTNTSAETAATVAVVDPAAAGSTNEARTHADSTLTIGEVQLGLEWDYALQCLPANAFFTAALEYQQWNGGHGSSSAESFAGAALNEASNQITATASTGAPVMDLFGFTLGTGLTW